MRDLASNSNLPRRLVIVKRIADTDRANCKILDLGCLGHESLLDGQLDAFALSFLLSSASREKHYRTLAWIEGDSRCTSYPIPAGNPEDEDS